MRSVAVCRFGSSCIVGAVGMAIAVPALGYWPADRWSAPASGPAGFRGTGITLTWSLVPDGTPIRSRSPSRLISLLDAHFHVDDRNGGELPARPWFPLLESAFGRWGELGGVSFVYEPHDDGAVHGQAPGELGVRGDIRLGATADDGPGGTLAFSQFPDGADIGLDADDLAKWLDPAADYRPLRNVLMHEIGHALGLDHVVSSDARFLMEPVADWSFDGPQLDDIRGLHYLYGDRFDGAIAGPGNNTAAAATDLGLVPVGRSLSLGGDAGPDLRVEPADVDFLSISGALDADYFSFRVDRPAWLDVNVTPLGGRFHQGRVGGAELLHDATAGSNLSFSLLASDLSLLAHVNQRPEGGAETLSQWYLPAAGRYVLLVEGSREVVQLYRLDLALTAPRVPEPRALAPFLIGAAGLCAYRRRG